MKLSLQTRDGELVEQWDLADFGDLMRAMSQRHFMLSILEHIERGRALEKLRALERATRPLKLVK